MEVGGLRDIIERMDVGAEPRIEMINRETLASTRLGVFASSFNPPTTAHIELMRRAADIFSLDEVLSLAGKSNADKTSYECSLIDRLAMLLLAATDDSRISVGLSSHAFYVDMLEGLERIYPQTDLHFIVGFDTFERVMDREDRYTAKYYRHFPDRLAAIEQLLTHSSLIVASRSGAGRKEVRELLKTIPASLAERVTDLDFPTDLGERSSTEVRSRLRSGKSISGLVPPLVERYIAERGLYGGGSAKHTGLGAEHYL